jgi:hypothetical protein
MNNERSGGDPTRDYSAPIPAPLDAYKQTNLIGPRASDYYGPRGSGLDSYNFFNRTKFRQGKSVLLNGAGVATAGAAPDQLFYNTGTEGLNKYRGGAGELLSAAYGTQTVDPARGGLAKAAHFAYSTPGVIFRYNGTDGILYDLREKHRGYYEDVEDGFTPDRTNYNQATVTLAELAAQVKTLKRDLARAGIL